ncbi:MAG: sigma-54-dependent Fis family transcriptional regulator [Saprospiraceae bacterium]|nr:sigma-54-dependent Fis family transcriptional regulator [Saprospiraceae bacterium]
MDNLQSIKQRFGIIGQSPLLDRALSTAVRVAPTDLTVLLSGESGVGKEVFSRIIHSLSARKHNKFIAINCGAIPEGTINSELFGHEKGAFTGATNERKGYFEAYDGGTIFLDEIGEMPLDTQSFLLRVLENGEFIRVGSSTTFKTDVRIIAATNVPLEERVRKGKFREDLFYRLNTVPIRIPALRERQEDIYMLFRKFASDFAEKYRIQPVQLDEKARLLLENYAWPGNIRELKNIAEQVSVLVEDRKVDAEEILRVAPMILNRNLPMIPDKNGREGANMHEREILYKLLFDMKGDLNDLKNLVFELIRSNDLNVPDTKHLHALQSPAYAVADPMAVKEVDLGFPAENRSRSIVPYDDPEYDITTQTAKPILVDKHRHDDFDNMEMVEENLSLAEMEKELIRKALIKHGGRRKEAAQDLGISERTLYRKIKEYDMQ